MHANVLTAKVFPIQFPNHRIPNSTYVKSNPKISSRNGFKTSSKFQNESILNNKNPFPYHIYNQNFESFLINSIYISEEKGVQIY